MEYADIDIGPAYSMQISIDQITAFIAMEWKRGIALSVPSFYRWQFLGAPSNVGLDQCVLVVRKGKEVLGFMGLHEREFNFQGRRALGAELTTWMISDKVRGRGFGRKILEYLQDRYAVLTGMGISDMALKIYLKCGFRWIRYIPRHVKVFREDSIARIGKVSALGSALIARYNHPASVSYSAIEISFGGVQSLVDSLHNDFNCFVMDTNYLEWRYANHPTYRYRVFSVDHWGGTGVVVLRTEFTPDARIVHVIDVISPKPIIPAIINFIEDFGRDEDADFADWFCLSDRISHIFWDRGWFSALHDHFIVVPHLYFPLEVRTPPTTSAVVWSKDQLSELLNLSNFYLTKGNNDLDRPTQAYFACNEMRTDNELQK